MLWASQASPWTWRGSGGGMIYTQSFRRAGRVLNTFLICMFQIFILQVKMSYQFMSSLIMLKYNLSSTNFLLRNHTIEKKYLEYFKWAYEQLRPPTALAEKLTFHSWDAHEGQLTTSSNYSSQWSRGLFWAPQTSVSLCTCSHRHTYIDTHICT